MCCILLKEEGAEREPVGGGRRDTVILYIYISEEGAGREPVGGGRWCYCVMKFLYTCLYHGGRGRAGAGRRGKTGLPLYYINIHRRKGPGGSR